LANVTSLKALSPALPSARFSREPAAIGVRFEFEALILTSLANADATALVSSESIVSP
jgi:hypothetical protein